MKINTYKMISNACDTYERLLLKASKFDFKNFKINEIYSKMFVKIKYRK